MREYEVMVVFNLSLAEADGTDAGPNIVTSVIEGRAGRILNMDHWGRRRMAYPIDGMLDADYVVARAELEPDRVVEIENILRLNERILRHLIVRADELPSPQAEEEPEAPAAEAPVSTGGAAPATTDAEPPAPAPAGAVEPAPETGSVPAPVAAEAPAAADAPAAAPEGDNTTT